MADDGMPDLLSFEPIQEPVKATQREVPPSAEEVPVRPLKQRPEVRRFGGESASSLTAGPFTASLTLSISAEALERARRSLRDAANAGDYRYREVSKALRAALAGHLTGRMPLEALVEAGPRSVRRFAMGPELAATIRGELPSGSRSQIAERALLTFLARGMPDFE